MLNTNYVFFAAPPRIVIGHRKILTSKKGSDSTQVSSQTTENLHLLGGVEETCNMQANPGYDQFDEREDRDERPLIINMGKRSSDGLSCAELRELNPSKEGHGYKKDNSLWAYFFPWFFDAYKPRYFVLIGNYLYRFSSEHSESVKGVPIPVDGVAVRTIGDCSFEVSTIRKLYIIKVASDEDAMQWVDAIKQRKLATIKENLGHAYVDPSIKRMNNISSKMFDKRLQTDRDLGGSKEKNPMDGMYGPY